MADETRRSLNPRPSAGTPAVDPRLVSPGREGLTGTAPAMLYKRIESDEGITIAPDWRPMDVQPAWRRDFPIDWPQDHFVERREFMKFLVLTSCAFTVGQLWIGVQSFLRGRRGALPVRRVAALADVPVGGVLTFTYPGEHDDCVLARTGERTLVAYGQKCTHLSCAVIPRPAEGVIHCPCHNGYFDLQTGRPIAGPPRRPLPLVHVELRGGDIYATGVEERTV